MKVVLSQKEFENAVKEYEKAKSRDDEAFRFCFEGTTPLKEDGGGGQIVSIVIAVNEENGNG